MISILLAVRQPVRIFLVIIYLAGIAALSLLPAHDIPKIPLIPGVDKIVHFIMYLGFSILFCWALKTEKHFSRIYFIVFATVGWGILLEFAQRTMHLGRSFSLYDVVANCLGVLVGILIYVLAVRVS